MSTCCAQYVVSTAVSKIAMMVLPDLGVATEGAMAAIMPLIAKRGR